MNADSIERIKKIIQDWVEEHHPNLRIGCDKIPVFPAWELTRLTLPNPHPLGKIQFTRLETVDCTDEEYVDQLKSWIGERSRT